jgi:fructose-bisphosphate aldolase/6-deoxy-5-ketofructose 1-phosphate synthase
MMMVKTQIRIPLDVPQKAQPTFKQNFRSMTLGTGRLMLFAGDQKIEHLNDDFFGPGIHPDDGDPEHLFRIASNARIGVFATQLGLIARYGEDYPTVPYLVKLNGKTTLTKPADHDPFSTAWYSVEDVVAFQKQSDLSIHGVGYTIYPGSAYEHTMLHEAAQVVRQAHEYGLVTVLWVYPKGSGVKNVKDPHLIAGACGIAACLGSDFARVNPPPKKEGMSSAVLLREAVLAAGRTRVVCGGGSIAEPLDFLRELHEQIHSGGAAGNATGRNIHQRSLPEAIRMCNAISALTFDDADVETAIALYREQKP